MEENETLTEVTQEVNPQITDAVTQEEPQQDQPPMTNAEMLQALIQRRTGNFTIVASINDLKYFKNSLNSRIEWKGPNEAYLAVISNLSLTQAISEMDPKAEASNVSNVSLPASVIESLNFFINRISGTGLDAAQKLFGAAMLLRQSVETIKQIDDEINTLQNQIEIESQKS